MLNKSNIPALGAKTFKKTSDESGNSLQLLAAVVCLLGLHAAYIVWGPGPF